MTFSPSFNVKAQDLIHKSERNHWSSGKVFLRKVAIVALISAMLLLTACSIPAVREAIIDFFFKDVGTHYEFNYDPEQALLAPDSIETVFTPTYVPAGYVESIRNYFVNGVMICWDSDTSYITFLQNVIPENPQSGDGVNFNSENAEAKWITVNECDVLRIEDAEWVTYTWTSSDYMFSIVAPKSLGDHEMEMIFDSIRIDEEAFIIGSE